MCGIVAMTGVVPVAVFLFAGLTRLKKRGYDSAGMALAIPGKLEVLRTVGSSDGLQPKFQELPEVTRAAVSGIAHTRWATHGAATEENAHPHIDCDGRVAVVHNGIIENWRDLAKDLKERGHVLRSQTDTELIAHLVEESLKAGLAPEHATLQVLKQLRGAYGLVLLFRDAPGLIIAARQGSPVLLGRSDGAWAVASSHEALFSLAQDMLELKDGDVVALRPGEEQMFLAKGSASKEPQFIRLEGEQAAAKLDGHPHFMIKEIYQGPEVVRDVIAGRLDPVTKRVTLGGLEQHRAALQSAESFLLVGCGSAYYASLFGKQLFEKFLGIPTDVQLASEFVYGSTPRRGLTVMIAVSQSGETKETAMAVESWKSDNRLAFGVLNGVGSLISRLTGVGMYTRAGEEVSVASTKALVSQLVSFVLLTLYLAQVRGIDSSELELVAKDLLSLDEDLAGVLTLRPQITKVAQMLTTFSGMYFLGRQNFWPIALEGALKLKEVAYLHAEAYPTAEMKHGPLALVGERFPCIVFCPRDSLHGKNLSAISEIRARRSPVIVVTDEGNPDFFETDHAVLTYPYTHLALQPILAAVVMQLLAYEAAVHLGNNVDTPKNLAKVVTVE